MTTRRETQDKGGWTQPALRLLRERYLLRDGDHIRETPEEMCRRVARAIARAEERWGRSSDEISHTAEEFEAAMLRLLFLPNSPTLMNAGREPPLQYSGCYVLPVEDSLESIFEALKRAALIHKSGGGTGFSFSRLRARGSRVESTGGRASGPVSFMRVFDAATEVVKQGGVRRGANMGVLQVDHPDILEFIDSKLVDGLTNFNISVAITDAFMATLARGGSYPLVDPHTGPTGRSLDAEDVFLRIARAAWMSGDPGVLFIDRVNASPANPTPGLGRIEATNPCGEQPLLPNEPCNLGSVNLSRLVGRSRRRGRDRPQIDWDSLERVVRLAVRFLDDVIEVNPYPLPELATMAQANRRIGLGVMGWADLLIQMGIPYDSDEAVALAERVMSFIQQIGHSESEKLASERGPFPNWPTSIYKSGPPLRNSTVTTIAPTGSISIIAGCSPGIEPIFGIAYSHMAGDRQLTFVNPYFEEVARARGFYSDQLVRKVLSRGTLQGLDGIPDDIQRLFATAHEISPQWHVRMQAAFQRHTDNGVSKTVNLPRHATPEEIADLFRLAYQLGCLGLTVFREGSARGQVLRKGISAAEELEGATVPTISDGMRPRPRVVRGVTYREETPLGTAFITVNRDDADEPFEVFLNVGKAGSDTAAVSEAIGRLISMALRLPSSLSPKSRLMEVADQLSGIGGGHALRFGRTLVRSLPDALARVLSEYLEEGAAPSREAPTPTGGEAEGIVGPVGDLCPECGEAALISEGGCRRCYACGFSEC